MHNILHKCQKQIGHWVGSSVIHLGDHNVPNALMFIDKYTQVTSCKCHLTSAASYSDVPDTGTEAQFVDAVNMATCFVFASVSVLYGVYLIAFVTGVWLKHGVSSPVLWSV